MALSTSDNHGDRPGPSVGWNVRATPMHTGGLTTRSDGRAGFFDEEGEHG